MRVLLVVFAVFAISAVTFLSSSCGILDDEAKVDCAKMCNKEKECNTEMTDTDVAECKNSCEKIVDSGYYQDALLKEVNTCYEKACSEIDSCMEKASGSCEAPDYMPYVNATCDKMIECGTEGTREECVSSGKETLDMEIKEGDMIKCFTTKAFEYLGSCIEKANCSSLDNDMYKCITDILGE